MNHLRRIIVAAVALMLFCPTLLHAQEAVVDTAGVKKIDFPTDAPMFDAKEQKMYYIREINVHGVKYLNHDVLRSSAGLIVGDSVYLPSQLISNAISRLWSQKYFSDVKIGAEIEGDSVDLEVMLKERLRVNQWAFEGIPKGQQKDMYEKLKLRRGGELSDYVMDKNTKLIQAHFAEKGFRNTEVDIRVKSDSVRPELANVTFVITKNPKVKIREINFIGNTEFDEKRLRRAFKKTRQKSINIFKSAKLDEEEYENDKELLIDFYNSKGYRNATIITDSIYDIDEKGLGINVEVSEGNKYYIRDVSWVGNSIYETSELSRMFGVESGDIYDKKSMHKRLGIGKEENPEDMSIKSLYQNEGYLMSQIEPEEIIIGQDSIDLALKIFEGKQFTINEVKISGNIRVDDEVIRRELYTNPGELYNRSLLMQTIRMLGTIGHFNPEAIMPDINPVTDELVNVGWALEEQASDQFNIAGGWGSDTFVGSVGITLNNLSLRNFFNKGSWRPYPQGQNQKLSISAQTNGTYYKAFSGSFTDPWVGGKKPNSLTISGHWSEQNDAYYAWQNSTRHFRASGVAAGIGKRLSWPDPYFTLYTELSYEHYDLKEWDSFIMKNGNANLLSAKVVLGRNSIDQPIYPRRGSDISISVQFTPPFSLWDGKDYEALQKQGEDYSATEAQRNIADQERYRWIEFHKWNFKAQWFQALTTNTNLVLMAQAEMGYLGSYNKFKTSPFERFEVGGDGMSGYSMYGVDIISMRGYEDGALDPGNYSMAYNKYTVELRYPVILKPSSQIYVLGFLEGGNGFESWSDFSPFKIKRSAGFGVRLYLPVVGMLGIDWGYGFDAPAGSMEKSGSQFHFVMGQQF